MILARNRSFIMGCPVLQLDIQMGQNLKISFGQSLHSYDYDSMDYLQIVNGTPLSFNNETQQPRNQQPNIPLDVQPPRRRRATTNDNSSTVETKKKESVKQNRLTHIFNMFKQFLDTDLMKHRLEKRISMKEDPHIVNSFMKQMRSVKLSTYFSPKHINHWMKNAEWGHIFRNEFDFFINSHLSDYIFASTIQPKNYDGYFQFINSYLSYSSINRRSQCNIDTQDLTVQ